MKKTWLWMIAVFPTMLLAQDAPDRPVTVEVHTSLGSFVLELHPDKAPVTVDNFMTYVSDGYYDGTIFHRVIAGFVAQGGGYDTHYIKKETRDPIVNESRNGLINARGTISMARLPDPHTANAQFYINLSDNINLDATDDQWGYAVFGKVVHGMQVIDRIAEVPTGPGGPFRRDAPQSMIIIERMIPKSAP